MDNESLLTQCVACLWKVNYLNSYGQITHLRMNWRTTVKSDLHVMAPEIFNHDMKEFLLVHLRVNVISG